jgi:alpha-1,3-mannosyl-glycoprotein beta-1,2-N-acetylglucosaminyltransferase
MERVAYLTIFSLVGFWILAVFALVFHSMHAEAVVRAAAPPQQPHELLTRKEQVPKGALPKIQAVAATPLHPVDLPKYMSPLLIFTCNRADYLKQTMTEVLKYMPKTCEIGCPLIISQDGTNTAVAAVIQNFIQQYEGEIPIVHLMHPAATKQTAGTRGANWQIAYKLLAVHYGWALRKTFDGSATPGYPRPDRVLILEEDLHISPDFFEYFGQMAPLLDQDPTLLAVSAFNDNGKEGKIKDATRVMRSDFFPGLGWMMNRKLWDTELSSKWPDGFWDDWLREPVQRQGRHILRPEVRSFVKTLW